MRAAQSEEDVAMLASPSFQFDPLLSCLGLKTKDTFTCIKSTNCKKTDFDNIGIINY